MLKAENLKRVQFNMESSIEKREVGWVMLLYHIKEMDLGHNLPSKDSSRGEDSFNHIKETTRP